MRSGVASGILALVVACGLALAPASEGGEPEPLPVVFVGTTGAVDPVTELAVGDVARLYEVLDLLATDPPSLGVADSSVRIQLAANAIYRLDPTKRDGGRVVLPPGATLAGGNVVHDYEDLDGNARPDGIPDAVGTDVAGEKIYATDQTILDGGRLADDRGSVRGAIETVLDARIHNLTVRSAAAAPAVGIGAAISLRPAILEKTVHVSETILEGGRRGIHVTSQRPQGHVADDTRVRLVAERSVFRNFKGQNGWGVHFHQVLTQGLTMSGQLRQNRFYGNRTGLFLVQNGAVDSETSVLSEGNVIEEQHGHVTGAVEKSAGVWISRQMGTGPGILQAPRDNRMRLHSVHDAIWNNPGSGGILVESANRGSAASSTTFSGNDLDLQMIGTRLVKPGATHPQNRTTDAAGNPLKRRDVTISGPIGTGAVATSNNEVRVLLRRVSGDDAPAAYDAAPRPLVIRSDDPEKVRITITGSPAFTKVNEAPEFFAE